MDRKREVNAHQMDKESELTAQKISAIHQGTNIEMGGEAMTTTGKVKALDIFVNEQMLEYLHAQCNSLGSFILKKWFAEITEDTQAEGFFSMRINYMLYLRGVSQEDMFVQRSFWLFEFDHPVRAQCRNIVAHPVCATLSFPRC